MTASVMVAVDRVIGHSSCRRMPTNFMRRRHFESVTMVCASSSTRRRRRRALESLFAKTWNSGLTNLSYVITRTVVQFSSVVSIVHSLMVMPSMSWFLDTMVERMIVSGTTTRMILPMGFRSRTAGRRYDSVFPNPVGLTIKMLMLFVSE